VKKFVVSVVLACAFSVLGVTGFELPAQATACLSMTPVTAPPLASNSDYTGCHNDGFDFRGLTASNINFSIATLGGAHFDNSTFSQSNFNNASGGSFNFPHANLDASTFRHTDMQGSDLTAAVFSNADMSYAHLENSTMNGVIFTGAILNNVFLAGADLTGATVTQAQLAIAVLSDTTVCPDGNQLGVHVGDCFSVLKALVPVVSTPVLTNEGFTFNVTNYNELYTFTVTTQSGTATPAVGSPSGATLPITVTGVPAGTKSVVVVTSSIGSGSQTVTASSTATNVPELPHTGVTQVWALALGGTAGGVLIVGIVALLIARRRSL
jgi:LPXTG-motif cell wall-anchored protein